MRQAREKQEISSLTDLELSKQLGNAKSNISKGKNELEQRGRMFKEYVRDFKE